MGKRRMIAQGLLGATVLAFVFDRLNDQVLSRTARTFYAGFRILCTYKLQRATTPEEISERHRRAAKIMLDVCLKNEGMYFKFAQGIYAMNNSVPPEYVQTLEVCLDRVKVVPFPQIKRVIEEETKKPLREVFVEFDETPVASASIAQVHRASIRDSETGKLVEVAVKVQRPKINRQLWWDLSAHYALCWFAEKACGVPIIWVGQTFIDEMSKEVRFTEEASNMERCAELFRQRRDFAVPKVYRGLTTDRLLTAEWITAPKLAEVSTITAQFDPAAVFRTVFEVYGDMIFQHGFVHADPHPANLLIREQPQTKGKKHHQVVLLDFGLCLHESPKFRSEFTKMFTAIAAQDFAALDSVVAAWGIPKGDILASMMTQKKIRRPENESAGTAQPIPVPAQSQPQPPTPASKKLMDASLVPRELVFLGRTMNLLRLITGLYNDPVDRFALLAQRATLCSNAHA